MCEIVQNFVDFRELFQTLFSLGNMQILKSLEAPHIHLKGAISQRLRVSIFSVLMAISQRPRH